MRFINILQAALAASGTAIAAAVGPSYGLQTRAGTIDPVSSLTKIASYIQNSKVNVAKIDSNTDYEQYKIRRAGSYVAMQNQINSLAGNFQSDSGNFSAITEKRVPEVLSAYAGFLTDLQGLLVLVLQNVGLFAAQANVGDDIAAAITNFGSQLDDYNMRLGMLDIELNDQLLTYREKNPFSLPQIAQLYKGPTMDVCNM